MRNKWSIGLGAVVIGFVATWLAIVAGGRWRDARGFSAPHQVHTPAGIPYVIQLKEVTVGRTAAGPVVVVTARIENPNSQSLTLNRQAFVLVDQQKNFYLPAVTPSAEAAIELPAHGVAEREMFRFTVAETAFAGSLGLQIGQQYWTLIKNVKPYRDPLNPDEFRSFRRVNW